MFLKNYWICLVLIFVFFTKSTYAQRFNPPYPRIAQFTWGGGRVEWYAKFDLLVIGHGNADRHAKAIKAINPDAIVLETADWNKGNPFSSVPDKWKVRNSKGEFFKVWGDKKLIDYTDFCPFVNGQRANTQLPQLVAAKVNNNPSLDGVGSDGLWFEITNGDWLLKGDVDLDRNGVNDFQEHGKDWVANKWTGSIINMVARYRNLVGDDKIIHINSGKFHKQAWDLHNGPILERSWAVKFGYDSFLKRYFDFIRTARQPHTLLLDGHRSYTDLAPGNGFERNLMMMRFLLCTTLLGDGYFSFSDTPGEHHYYQDFDEFHVNLDYPTEAAQEIGQGIWVRFFQNGVSIVNASGTTRSITDGDLQGLSGYEGPYFHFVGGQNPSLNNGQRFSSMTFFGAQGGDAGKGHRMGDATILVKQANAAFFADIIIDNIQSGTLSGSKAAVLNGGWLPGSEVDANRPVSWHVGPHWIDSRYTSDPYYSVAAGSGSAKATFKPTIGVSGSYRVYEWHGNIAQGQAGDVPYEIHHQNGIAKGRLDQSRNFSRWNLLGTFKFTKGTSGYATITNNAGGIVVADAFKFVFDDGTDPGADPGDTTPPNPPEGVKVGN